MKKADFITTQDRQVIKLRLAIKFQIGANPKDLIINIIVKINIYT